MIAWSLERMAVPRREIGAGAVSAVAALVVSLVTLPTRRPDPMMLSSSPEYWFVHAPGFALLAGFIVGAVVWRQTMSGQSTPRQGVRAGIVTAVGTVLLVPILIGTYVYFFPVLLAFMSGQEVNYALALYPTHLWFSIGVTRNLVLSWSPLVGAVFVPLGALIGWVYQGGLRRR